MSDPYILVVDDEPDIRHLVQEILEDEGYSVSVADGGESARAAIKEQAPRLVLLDIWMPGEDGISLLKDLNESGKLNFPVVMISGHGTVETAVEATRHGAVDFIEKPLSLAKLLLTVEKALQVTLPNSDNASPIKAPLELIGNSHYIKTLREQIKVASQSDQHLVITGEHASGKMLVAQHIHAESQRADKAFIQLRCDSLSPANSTRELLGDKVHGPLNSSYLESANGGTLFLNDVQLLPPAAQQVLLDILDKQGTDSALPFDVRFIASTHADLHRRVEQGEFSAELFAYLNASTICCKPLREHPEDIPTLLDYYVNWFVEVESLPYRHFTVAAQNRLRTLYWPGNLLELKNLIQRLMILGDGVEIDVPEVNEVLGAAELASKGDANNPNMSSISLDLPIREARAAFERAYMLHQLHLASGNIGELAKRVGMERTHLYRKLRTLNIDIGKSRS
jgi:DNA-binding NtrC family response regulator